MCFDFVRFIENKNEAKALVLSGLDEDGMLTKDDWLYQYADIKLNILMEYNAHSMIVECQFLLRFMQNAKSEGHQLYEITRKSDFINDMSNILNIAKDKQSQLFFLVHAGKAGANEDAFALFLMSYLDQIDLGKVDKTGLNVWHYICKLGMFVCSLYFVVLQFICV